MLFNRDLRGFSGGHLKFFDYLEHTRLLSSISPKLHLTATSNVELMRTLIPAGVELVAEPFDAGSFFVAGMDWILLDAARIDVSKKPVINLVQGVRHSFPDNPLYAYLSRPALRICVSVEIADALSRIPHVQGPIVVIENGTDMHSREDLKGAVKSRRVFIGGTKAPHLARDLATALESDGIATDLCEHSVHRSEFLSRLACAEIAVLLPLHTEGFFLPALEAMTLGTLAIVPDCIGSRQFCVHKSTCLVPKRNVSALRSAVHFLWNNDEARHQLRTAAHAMSATYTPEAERQSFHQVIGDYLQHW